MAKHQVDLHILWLRSFSFLMFLLNLLNVLILTSKAYSMWNKVMTLHDVLDFFHALASCAFCYDYQMNVILLAYWMMKSQGHARRESRPNNS